MTDFFKFESDFVDSLRCIPMVVRFKLDTCGVKLKLHQWNVFNEDDRKQLVNRSCETTDQIQEYRDFLKDLILVRSGEVASTLAITPNPAWLNDAVIPEEVVEKGRSFGFELSIEQWSGLSPLQRFALIKLSRSSHENTNFGPALIEFGLS